MFYQDDKRYHLFIGTNMAAHVCAAALRSLFLCSSVCVLFLLVEFCQAKFMYSRQDLINVGIQQNTAVTSDFHRTHNIPENISRPLGSPWIVIGSGKRRRRERKQKRGCRAGLVARLKRQPHKPPLPSIFLSNGRSIAHKMEDLELQLATNTSVRDCCVLLIMETWLNPLITDDAVQLAGHTIHCLDRSKDSGKSKGGALCVYVHCVHNDCCVNSRIIHTHCSLDLEALSVVCRPFYLPRELTAVIITAVYIPPDANTSTALANLHNVLTNSNRPILKGFTS